MRVVVLVVAGLLGACSAFFSESAPDSDAGETLVADADPILTDAAPLKVTCGSAALLKTSDFSGILMETRATKWAFTNKNALSEQGTDLTYTVTGLDSTEDAAILTIEAFSGDFAMDMVVDCIPDEGDADMVLKLEGDTDPDITAKVYAGTVAVELAGGEAKTVTRVATGGNLMLRVRRIDTTLYVEQRAAGMGWSQVTSLSVPPEASYQLRFAGRHDMDFISKPIPPMVLRELGASCE